MAMMINLNQRLIVAVDLKPTPSSFTQRGYGDIKERVLRFADNLKDTGVILKLNSALRLCGYEIIREISYRGLKVFADLKLNDIPETMTTDGILLAPYCPYMVTAMCSAGKTGLQTLKKELPDTEVIGVTALTSLLNEDTIKMFRCNATNASKRFAKEAVDARIDGVVCAATEAETIRDIIGKDMTINTPAIRPVWAIVAGDDQNPERIMTPARAIKARADRLVVGRPITQAESPRDAVMRTLEEIDKAL